MCARAGLGSKLSLLQGFRDREHLDWDSPRLGLIDIQWSDVRPERGLYNRLAERGRVERVLTEESISSAVEDPPEDTARSPGEVSGAVR